MRGLLNAQFGEQVGGWVIKWGWVYTRVVPGLGEWPID